MKTFGYGMVAVSGLFLVLVLCFGLRWLGIEWRGFFGPKEAEVERKIFKETRSYNEGMVQQLVKYRLEYMRAKTDQEREAIASTVRMMFADYDLKRLPNEELRNFLREVNR